MKVQLETNYLYYLSGVSKSSRVKIDKVNEELKGKQVVISAWSFIELVTTTDFNISQKKIVTDFILKNHIGILPFYIDGKYYSFEKLINAYYEELINYDNNKYELFCNKIVESKKDEEGKIIFFYTNLITTFIYLLLYNKLETMNISTLKKQLFTFCTTTLLVSNYEKMKDDTADIINEHYTIFKDSITKRNITNMFSTYLYILSLIFDNVVNGTIDSLYPDCFSKFDQSIITENNGPSNYSKIFLKQLNKFSEGNPKKINYTKIFDKDEIKVVYNKILSENDGKMAEGTLKYFLTHITKFLLDNKSFNKNDTLDSYMLNNDDDCKLLTDDSGTLNLMKDFNSVLYDYNCQFLNL